MGEKIKVGVGSAKGKNTYDVALKAFKESLSKVGGKANFTLVYAESEYDEKQILKAGNEVFGENWVGCSTDTQLTSIHGFEEDSITALSIKSNYLHFGIGVRDNYRKNPEKTGEEATKEALSNVHVDKYLDPYIQFRRAQVKSYNEIVRIPPYFLLTLICGVKYDKKGIAVPGRESEFVEGIFRVVGSNLPLVGAATSSDFDKYVNEKKTNQFQFANGKLYYDAGIVIFVTSNLYFSHSFTHGYVSRNQVALLTKVDKTGHIIEEINGRPAVEEYSQILGVSVDDLMKDPFKYTLPRPFGLLDTYGHIYIKEAVPNPDAKTMYCLSKVAENSAVVVVDYDQKDTLQAVVSSMDQADEINKHNDIELALVFSCCGRKALLGDKVSTEIDLARKKYKKVNLFGFHSFGEIGAKMHKNAQVCNQSVSTLLIYDKLLTD